MLTRFHISCEIYSFAHVFLIYTIRYTVCYQISCFLIQSASESQHHLSPVVVYDLIISISSTLIYERGIDTHNKQLLTH